jgi:hypothetical protein
VDGVTCSHQLREETAEVFDHNIHQLQLQTVALNGFTWGGQPVAPLTQGAGHE